MREPFLWAKLVVLVGTWKVNENIARRFFFFIVGVYRTGPHECSEQKNYELWSCGAPVEDETAAILPLPDD